MKQKNPVKVFILDTDTILNQIILDPSFPSNFDGHDIVIPFGVTKEISKKSNLKI